MTESTHVANYILESILRDLSYLKDNNFLPTQMYRDVVSILPSRIESTSESKPPLPVRKSTNSSISVAVPIPQPRSSPNTSYPQLPVRKTNDWQQSSPAIATAAIPAPAPAQLHPPIIMPANNTNITKNILQTASPEPAPPAYTQKEKEPLATAEALYDYHGEDPSTDLSFKQGNIIEVTEYVNDDWWKGTVNGKSGIFPQNHVKKIAPTIKAKRPWAPTTSAKPSFSTSSNTSSYTQQPSPQMQYNQPTTQQPYSYPPPPTALYQAPPMQPPIQSYGQPSSVPVIAQQQAPVTAEGEQGDKKVQNMAKKFGGNVATAATWGFGATLGSQAANAIF